MRDCKRECFVETLSHYQSQEDPNNCWFNIPNVEKVAAVLIILVEVGHTWSLVFIERAINEKDPHSGQVAFPGGKYEQNDNNLIDTALRETREEIGVTIQVNDVIAALPSKTSISDFHVQPIVAISKWPQKTQLQSSEVASVFTIPLDWLANTDNLETSAVLDLPKRSTIIYKKYNGKRLWGLTAVITQQLIKIIETS